MNAILKEIIPETEERFEVYDDKSAEWALQKLAEIRTEEARLVGACNEQIAFYQQQAQHFKDRAENSAAYFIGLLNAYFDTVPHKTTATQEKYQLPSGSLVLKKGRVSFKRDEAAMLAWCKAKAPKHIKVVESTDWDGANSLKKSIIIAAGAAIYAETGELVEGVIPTIGADSFTVELAKGV